MAATKEIGVDTAVLIANIRELQSKLAASRSQLSKMTTSVNELSTMWQGKAQTEFVKQFSEDVEMTEDMFATVESIIESMEFAKNEYDLCESEIGELVATIGK